MTLFEHIPSLGRVAGRDAELDGIRAAVVGYLNASDDIDGKIRGAHLVVRPVLGTERNLVLASLPSGVPVPGRPLCAARVVDRSQEPKGDG